MSYWSLLLATAPVVLAVLVGWGVRRVGWLSQQADASLLKLVVNLLYPALIFESVLSNSAARALGNLALAPPLGFAAIALGFMAAWAAARLGGIREWAKAKAFIFTVGIFNYGYVPVPLVKEFYGPDTLGVLFVFNLGVELAIWTVGIAFLARGGDARPAWRRVLNPSALALVGGVALNLSGAHARIPAFLVETIHMLGACSIPLGLLLIGATLADEASNGQRTAEWRAGALACVLRLLALPLLFLLAARWLPASQELKQVIVVQAAMPCGILPIVLAKHHGGDVPTALWTVLGTSALGVFLIPWWIRVGGALAGLPPLQP